MGRIGKDGFFRIPSILIFPIRPIHLILPILPILPILLKVVVR